MKAHVVASCCVLLAAPAFAAPSDTAGNGNAAAPSASPAPQGAADSGDHARADQRQICRRIDSEVSRRIGSRLVCHTAQEWRAIQQD